MSTASALAAVRLGRNNLFDLVGFYAAVQVLLVHGREHLGFSWPGWVDPWLALPAPPLHHPDLSYGLYLFHMPLYLVGVVLLACLSWYAVERPALQLKPRAVIQEVR